MNLFSRGITFVTLPLAFMVILVVVLYSQFMQAMDVVEEQSRSREKVSKCYALENQVVEAFCDLLTTTDATGMVNQQKSRAEFRLLEEKLQDIVRVFESDSKNQKKAIEIQVFWRNTVTPFVEWFLAAQSHGELYWKRANEGFPLRLLAICDKFLTLFTDLITSEKGNFAPEKTNAQWSALKQVPLFAIAASLIVGLILAAIYALTIKRPVSRISENCRRMAANEKLLPPLMGRDELSELDRLFHRLALNVNDALAKEKAMIENARDMICSLNSDGRFLRVNQSSALLLGVEPEILLGQTLLDICGSEESIRADDEIRTSCKTTEMRTFDLRLKRADNSPVDTRWSCVWSARDNELFAVVHDITEEKNVERLKQDFVDMISHDLRSPLTSMLGSLSMIEQGARGPLPDEAQKEVSSAVKNVERLVEFINDLLDFQKLKSGRMQLERSDCDLLEVVVNAADMVRSSAAEKNVELLLPKEQVTVYGDSNKLSQVAVNLIANAIRYAPEDSSVEVQLISDAEALEMRVIDNGPGVPIAYRDVIFDAFQQVPTSAKKKQGTGLGLAICKLIVDAHGGTIGVTGTAMEDILSQVESVREAGDSTAMPKSGSIFWIRLPHQR